MKQVMYGDLKWQYSERHGISLGVAAGLPDSSHADVVLARIPAGGALQEHYHKRPDDGYEAFFFFQGAEIALVMERNEEREIRSSEPFYLQFFSDEVHGIRNLASEDLVFEVICAPKFDPDEERFVN